MKIFKHTLVGIALLTIPLLVGAPVVPPEAVLPAGPGLLPRDVLLSRLAEALGSVEPGSPMMGRIPALAVAGALLLLCVWFVLRRRPIARVERPARDRRATVALDLLRGGATTAEAMVGAHVSRDAIELLRHTTIGVSFE